MRYVGTRHPLAAAAPLRSIPLLRPVAAVLGYTEAFKADWALQIARRDVAALEGGTAYRYAALGQANKLRGPMRRHWQSKAFRAINLHRDPASRRPQGPGGRRSRHAYVRPRGGGVIASCALPGLRMRPVRASARGDAAAALAVAGQARRTLAGQLPGGGFWSMPSGRTVILACWRQNIDCARRLRLGEAALAPAVA